MSDYREVFVREGEEQITELNNSLLALEQNPDDAATMDDVFRSAHTLKGNFAAMGYEAASDLAHAMEDLLDEMREDRLSVTAGTMDLVFEGVDQLEAALDEIEAEGEVTSDLGPLIADLRDHTEERLRDADDGGEQPEGSEPTGATTGTATATETDGGQDGDESPTGADAGADGSGGDGPGEDGDDGPIGPAATETILDSLDAPEALSDAEAVTHARLGLKETAIPGPDGLLVVEAVDGRYDLLASAPPREDLEDGDHGDVVDVFLGTAAEEATEDRLTSVQPIESAAVRDATAEVTGEGGPGGSAADEADSDAAGPTGETPGTAGKTPETAGDAPEATGEDPDAADPTGDGGAAAGGSDGVGEETGGNDAGGDELAPAGSGGSGDPGDGGPDGSGGPDGGDGGDGGDDDGGDDPDVGSSIDEIKSVRVDVDRLDELYGLVEQLVTNRIKLRRTIEDAGIDAGRDLDELDKTTSNLQDTVMEMRLVPMKKVVGKFPRLVRDLSRELDKEVSFEMTGVDVELDRTILDRLRDPLIHVLRNAVDHGIESPEERRAAGKLRTGSVELRARRERDRAVIEVSDDGRGLDADEIRQKALGQGIRGEEELQRMDDQEVYDLVFHPGFSTADEVTDVSGLDGTVDVRSEPGEGTTVTLELPVSVAIVKVLFVRAADREYGIPIKKVDTVSRETDVELVNGEEMIEHNDELYPVIRLQEALDTARQGGSGVGMAADGGREVDDGGMLVCIRESERPIALYCDEVNDQEEVVVKPLEGILSGTPGLSGTAVLGEGNVVPILDVKTI